MKLGLKPFTHDIRDLQFSRYRTGAPLPKHPAIFGHEALVKDWGMLGNDQYGDCVWAGAAHETMLWNAMAQRTVTFTTEGVLSDYAACTGFDANAPSTDQGTDMRVAMKYRQKTGIVDDNGNRHKIGAYVWIQPGNYDHSTSSQTALSTTLAGGISDGSTRETQSSESGSTSSDVHGSAGSYSSGSTSHFSHSSTFSTVITALNGTNTTEGVFSEGSTFEQGYTREGALGIASDGAFTLTQTDRLTSSSSYSISITASGSEFASGTEGPPPHTTTHSDTFNNSTTTTSTSGSTEIPGSISTTGAGFSFSWQTTGVSTLERDFTSWSDGSRGTTRLTVGSSLSTWTTDGGTTSSAVVFTSFTSSVQDWHQTVSSSVSQTTAVVTHGALKGIGLATVVVFEASPCHQLWRNDDGVDGISAFCEIFTSASRVEVSSSYSSSSHSGSDDAGGSSTTYGYDLVEGSTDYNGPRSLSSALTRVQPGIAGGYRPYSALDVTDAIYSTWSIAVASSVTDTAESALRAAGSTFEGGGGPITQVLTLHSDDTLHVSGLITHSTSTVPEDSGGGFPNAVGDMSATLGKGVYDLTSYDSSGGSMTTRVSVSNSTASTWARGDQVVMQIVPAFESGLLHLAGFPNLIETPCAPASTLL